MYCVKCGAELKPNAKFCSKCGSPVALPSAAEEVKVDRQEVPTHEIPKEIPKVQENSEAAPKKKRKPIALIVVLLLAVCAAAGAVVYLNSDAYHYKKNMKTANALYEEGNYREALEAYNVALEIDKDSEEAAAGKLAAYMGLGGQLYREEDYEGALDAYQAALDMQEDNTDAYLGMSNAYIRLEEFEQAVTILRDGCQATKDMTLKTREEYLMDNIVLVRVDILYRDREDGEWQQKSGRVGGDPSKYIYNYDDSGELSSEEVYTHYYVLGYDYTFINTTVYDVGGRIVELKEEEFRDDYLIFSNYDMFLCDSNGTELYQLHDVDNAELSYEDGRVVGLKHAYISIPEETFTYDDKGNLINVDLGGEAQYEYSYDDQERIIKKTEYRENGEPFSETVYEYDNNGNLTSEESTVFSGPWHTVHEWVYDGSGKLLEDNYGSDTGTSNWYEITYNYDAEGNISRQTYVTGDYESETTYTCDMFGNIVYEEAVTFDEYTQESTILYTEYTNTYAFIGDLGDDIDSQNAETSEGEEVVAEAEEADSGETASADAAEASDGEEATAVDETESSDAEDFDIAEEEAPEDEKPALDINVEDEVKQIREWFYGTQDSLGSYEQSTSDNVTFYLEDGIPVKIVVKKGTDGWDYAREYYYHDGEFYFAFIYAGSDEHRLYFKDDQMIRYIDQDKNTYDYGETDRFPEWETPAIQEAYRLLEAGWN